MWQSRRALFLVRKGRSLTLIASVLSQSRKMTRSGLALNAEISHVLPESYAPTAPSCGDASASAAMAAMKSPEEDFAENQDSKCLPVSNEMPAEQGRHQPVPTGASRRNRRQPRNATANPTNRNARRSPTSFHFIFSSSFREFIVNRPEHVLAGKVPHSASARATYSRQLQFPLQFP